MIKITVNKFHGILLAEPKEIYCTVRLNISPDKVVSASVSQSLTVSPEASPNDYAELKGSSFKFVNVELSKPSSSPVESLLSHVEAKVKAAIEARNLENIVSVQII